MNSPLRVSRASRRLAGRIESGESIVPALRALVAAHGIGTADFRANGVLEDAVLTHQVGDPASARISSQTLAGPCEVLSLTGRFAPGGDPQGPVLFAIVAHNGVVNGGRLAGGRIRWLDVVLECWDEQGPVEEEHVARPAAESHARAPAAVRAPPQTLAEAVQRIEEMPARHPDETEERPDPEVGDLLDHPSFGIVEIEGEGESGRVKIRLNNGSRREIMLEVFDVTPREALRGKNLFALKPRRR